jgi:hypothetical protein
LRLHPRGRARREHTRPVAERGAAESVRIAATPRLIATRPDDPGTKN